jgi:syntaxin 16
VARSIMGLAEIFKDMQTLVIAQGSLLDRIDYNIEATVTEMKAATFQLEKGAELQKKTGKKIVILLLIAIVFTLFVAAIMKPR